MRIKPRLARDPPSPEAMARQASRPAFWGISIARDRLHLAKPCRYHL